MLPKGIEVVGWVVGVLLFSALWLHAQASQPASGGTSSGQATMSVPRLIKFSGAVKDVTGKPLNGPVEVNFAIYKEQTDAAPLWQETQTLQLDEQGRYTVLLGAMQGEGLPMELFASGEARWLGVQAQGAETQPRVLLVSVPYALKAADAETLAGKRVSDFVLAQQLKEQVKTEVTQQAKQQQERGQQALALVLGTGPTPPAISEGPSSFTCATAGDCVGISQIGTGRALRAAATSSTEAVMVVQSGTGYGVRVTATSGAVYGISTAPHGSVSAVRGDSASPDGRGILGNATATTGSAIGLYGSAASPTGTGVYGEATSMTGSSYGIRAKAFSASGTGLLGDATATTGTTYGLRGRSYSSGGTGILAYAMATTGTTKGLWAEVYSADGTAAVFQNTANGKLVSGVVGTGTGTEVFSVAGTGNLASAGTLSGTQLISTVASGTAPLQVASSTGVPNLNADLLDGLHASAFQPAGTYATLGANTFTGTQTISSGDLSVGSGDISLPQTTSASAGVINLGGSAFIHACCGSSWNTFVGTNAGNFGMSGPNNTASGSQALYSNTAGGNNTASGFQALSSNTEGWNNTASGAGALGTNTSGSWNTASGFQALSSNTTGNYNTADGYFALYSNSDGSYNTASGYDALGLNCSGVSSGCAAHYNTALGYYAGVTSTAANANKTGANNTFIGAYSGPGTPAPLTNATAIGYNALVSASNSLVLGGTGGYAVNVGIGTTTPAYRLDVQGTGNFTGLVTFAGGQTFPGTGTVTSVGSGAGLTGGPITGSGTLSVATGGVTNAMLQNSSLTVSAGSGLSGGGAVSLGGSTTLSLNPNVSVTTGAFSGNNATQIVSVTQNGSGMALLGTNAANGSYGQLGTSVSGGATGVYGSGSYIGVWGNGNPGVYGESSNHGVIGRNSVSGSFGRLGTSESGHNMGVYGLSGEYGIYGSGSTGVYGSGSNYGVFGSNSTNSSYGLLGTSVSGNPTGVYGNGSSYGVEGWNSTYSSYGLLGTSVTIKSTNYATGVYGSGSTFGVYGSGGTGVFGSGSSYGVQGDNSANASTGRLGTSVTIGSTHYATGAFGTGAFGVYGIATSGGAGVYGTGGDYAGFFVGNVAVVGNLSKASGGFKIDHPLDPGNKYLVHSFVESPDMKNVYDGVAILDAAGEAWVGLPDWFETLNTDFRYQLTSIGAPAPNLYIAEEISANRFKIAGGRPGGKVCWQVTGIRQDAYAKAHRLPVEKDKAEAERGFYLHPELYGQPETQAIRWARHSEQMRELQKRREEPETPVIKEQR